MNIERYEKFLKEFLKSDGTHLSDPAIRKRIVSAKKAEEELKAAIDLDRVVSDDGFMRFALDYLRKLPGKGEHDPMGNTLRKYYQMINKKEFPKLRDCQQFDASTKQTYDTMKIKQEKKSPKTEALYSSGDHIRPDKKVGKLAQLAFSTYLQSAKRDPAEIVRLQNGDYCHKTFVLNRTMPVLVPVSVIVNAPSGDQVGEAGFYKDHYYVKVFDVDGVEFRVVNDWKESPNNPRDNRTPLENWIRKMGLEL